MVYYVKKRFEIKEIDEFLRKLTINEVRRRSRERMRKFKRYGFNVKGLVLDAGSGVGIDLMALFSLGNEIEAVGVDISNQALKIAKKVLPGELSYLIRADIGYLPFKRNVFDAINVRNVLHHHTCNILKRIILNLREVLKDDGPLLIKEPCEASEKHALSEEIEDFRHGIDDCKELAKLTKSRTLREHLINILPMFRYGMTYQSLLKKIVTEGGLKIETFDIVREKSNKRERIQLLKEAKEKIEKSAFTSEEKAYLLEKLLALKEKVRLIGPIIYKSVIIKARKIETSSPLVKNDVDSESDTYRVCFVGSFRGF